MAQSVRSSASEGNVATSALHANAAWQQGVLAALLAVLEYGAGAEDVLDADGKILVSTKHVQLAWRLVEVTLGIREVWRGPLQPQRDQDKACLLSACPLDFQMCRFTGLHLKRVFGRLRTATLARTSMSIWPGATLRREPLALPRQRSWLQPLLQDARSKRSLLPH